MTATRASSWSQRPDAAGHALLALAALACFLLAWSLLHVGFYERRPISDLPVYQSYGDRMERGDVPYRDFRVEYPPLALPAFVVPSLGGAGEDAYRRIFETLMAACGGATLVLVGLTLAALRARPLRTAADLGFVALAPLALGPVVLSRFDLWPAALTAAALAALVGDRHRLGGAALGLAIGAKLYPAVLLPLAVAWVWRRRSRREGMVVGAIALGVVAAAYLPFLVIAPEGVFASLGRQLSRPLQIESLGASFLLAAHHVFGTGLEMKSSHGSQNIAGPGAWWVGIAQSLVQAVVLVGVWVSFARDRAPTPERLLVAAAAALVAFVALGKVLSPQFLVWLIPVVPLVRGVRGAGAAALLAAALVLTQLWFPYRYWDLALRFDEVASWLVLARDLVLLGLLGVLAWPLLRRLRRTSRDPRIAGSNG